MAHARTERHDDGGPKHGAGDGSLPRRLVVDSGHRILRARGLLRPADGAPRRGGWLDGPPTAGAVLGCINAVVEDRPCGATTRCSYCTLRQAVERALAGEPCRDVPFERTCVVEGRPTTRRLLVTTRVMRTRGDASAPTHVRVALREAPPFS